MPYTVGLLSSIPRSDNFGGRLTPIKGAPPSLVNMPPGCPFSPRCPLADDRCRRDNPALQRVSAMRAAACWRLDVAAPELLAGRQGGGDMTS